MRARLLSLLWLPCFLFVSIFLTLPAFAGNWGENWGEMTWGEVIAAVPLTGQLGFLALVLGLLGVAIWAFRGRVATGALLLALMGSGANVAEAQVSVPNTHANRAVAQAEAMNENFEALSSALSTGVPHTFSNGTVADADEVNANFQALVDGANAFLSNVAAGHQAVCEGVGGTWDGSSCTAAPCDVTSNDAAVVAAAMPGCDWATELWDGASSSCVCGVDSATRDCIGVCGGSDVSCVGCDGVQNSGQVLDVCGVCGGDDSSCEGCDGVPNSGLVLNEEGCCGAQFIGCDGQCVDEGPVLDACGLCDGPGLNAWGCCGEQVMDCDGQCGAPTPSSGSTSTPSSEPQCMSTALFDYFFQGISFESHACCSASDLGVVSLEHNLCFNSNCAPPFDPSGICLSVPFSESEPETGVTMECGFGMTVPCAQALEGLECNPTSGPPMPVEYFTQNNPEKAAAYDSCLANGGTEEACYNLAMYGVEAPTCPEGWSFDMMSLMFEDEEAFMQMQMACPGQLVNTMACRPQAQTYSCYGAICGGWGAAADCNGFVCTAEDEVCIMDEGSGTCQAGASCTMDDGQLTCEAGSTCTGKDAHLICLAGSECTHRVSGAGVTSTGSTTCKAGATCTGTVSTGGVHTMNCEEGSVCSCSASTGGQCIW